MYKYNILKCIVVKEQNLLKMQKITLWSATNAISLIKGVYKNSLLN